MLSSRRYLAAALVLVSIVGACSSSGSTAALNSSAPATGGGGPTATTGAAPTPTTAGGSVAGGALGGTVGAGGDLCGLLGPGDFAAVGVSDVGTPTNHSSSADTAACDYSIVLAAASPRTGGATATPYRAFGISIGNPESNYQLIRRNYGIVAADATGDLPGVDAAGTQLDVGGVGDMAAIGVQKGEMTFDIEIQTTSSNARAQLIALAKVVLQRESGLSS